MVENLEQRHEFHQLYVFWQTNAAVNDRCTLSAEQESNVCARLNVYICNFYRR